MLFVIVFNYYTPDVLIYGPDFIVNAQKYHPVLQQGLSSKPAILSGPVLFKPDVLY